MVPETLTARVGGRLGVHAAPGGFWRDPRPWTYLTAGIIWLVLIARQLPCRLSDGHFPDSYLRLCYSDIWTLFLNRGMATDGGIFNTVNFEYPVVVGYIVMATRALTMPFVDQTEDFGTWSIEASQVFFQWNAVLLFAAFLVVCWVQLLLGRRSADPSHAFSWEAMFIAASPVVLLNGLINWDMFVVAFTALGLLAWAKNRPIATGVWLGIGFATKFYPVLVLIAITLLAIRAGKLWNAVAAWLWGIAAWLVVNLPIIFTSPDGWRYFWTFNADRGPDLGSIWYVAQLMGVPISGLSGIAFACMAAGGLGVIWLVIRAPRRPRVAQIALLLLIIFLIFNKVYSPQYALWLLPWVVLARPKLLDVSIWTLGEAIYYFCIWGMLQGTLGVGSDGEVLYWLAVLIRVVIQLWIALRVVDDILRPWADPVRGPHIDDPHGGPLDHCVDARWVVALSQARSRRVRTQQTQDRAEPLAAAADRDAGADS